MNGPPAALTPREENLLRDALAQMNHLVLTAHLQLPGPSVEVCSNQTVRRLEARRLSTSSPSSASRTARNDLELIELLGDREMSLHTHDLYALEDVLAKPSPPHARAASMEAISAPLFGPSLHGADAHVSRVTGRPGGAGEQLQAVWLPTQQQQQQHWGLQTPQQSPRHLVNEAMSPSGPSGSPMAPGLEAGHSSSFSSPPTQGDHVVTASPAAAGSDGGPGPEEHQQQHQQPVVPSTPRAGPDQGAASLSSPALTQPAPAATPPPAAPAPASGLLQGGGGAAAPAAGLAALRRALASSEAAAQAQASGGFMDAPQARAEPHAPTDTAAGPEGGHSRSMQSAAVVGDVGMGSSVLGSDGMAQGGAASVSAAVPRPVRAPAPDDPDPRVRALVSMYRRSVDSRGKLQQRLEQERREEEAQRLGACTFSPGVDKRSRRLVGRSASPGASEPEGGGWFRDGAESPTRDRRWGPAGEAAGAGRSWPAAAFQAVDLWGEAMEPRSLGGSSNISSFLARKLSPALGRAGTPPRPPAAPSPPRPSREPDFARRLHGAALHRREVLEAKLRHTLQEERQSRVFVARPVRGAAGGPISPKVYEPRPAPEALLHMGMEECTFHPRTNFRSTAVALARRRMQQEQEEGERGWQQATPDTPGSGVRGRRERTERPSSCVSPAALPKPQQHATFAAWAGSSSSSPGRRLGADPDPPGAGFGRQEAERSGAERRSLSPHLDWGEFLGRQDGFLRTRDQRQEGCRQQEAGRERRPAVSPSTRRILSHAALAGGVAAAPGEARWSAAAAARHRARSPPLQQQPLAEGGGASTVAGRGADPELTFRPKISARAARLPGRSLEQLVEGGRRKVAEKLEATRLAAEAAQAVHLTFRPSYKQTARAYPEVPARLSLRHPERQLSLWQHKQAALGARQQEAAREQEEKEMAECTFRPKTTPLPAYLNLRPSSAAEPWVALRSRAAAPGRNAISDVQPPAGAPEYEMLLTIPRQEMSDAWQAWGNEAPSVQQQAKQAGLGVAGLEEYHPGMGFGDVGERRSTWSMAMDDSVLDVDGSEDWSQGSVGQGKAGEGEGWRLAELGDCGALSQSVGVDTVQQAVQLLHDLDVFLGQGGSCATGWAAMAAAGQAQGQAQGEAPAMPAAPAAGSGAGPGEEKARRA